MPIFTDDRIKLSIPFKTMEYGTVNHAQIPLPPNHHFSQRVMTDEYPKEREKKTQTISNIKIISP